LVKGVLPLIIIASPWYLFTILIGLDLSPHGIEVAFHPEALKAMFQQLFLLGTFGIHWWAIVIMFVILINKDRLKFIKQPSFLWGILALIFILGTYTFTADVRGLINGDNFSRVMLLPTTLLTIALVRKWYDEVFN